MGFDLKVYALFITWDFFVLAFSSLALLWWKSLQRGGIVLGLLNADHTRRLGGWAEVLLLAWFTPIPLGVVYYHYPL